MIILTIIYCETAVFEAQPPVIEDSSLQECKNSEIAKEIWDKQERKKEWGQIKLRYWWEKVKYQDSCWKLMMIMKI